jgi:hypothetical protein
MLGDIGLKRNVVGSDRDANAAAAARPISRRRL